MFLFSNEFKSVIRLITTMTLKPVKLTHPELSLLLNLLNQASVQGIENVRVVLAVADKLTALLPAESDTTNA
ncbi:MAG: hypothetical protein CMA72_08860 [Euryarchaeota archaeon]|jgi:hypothetical protein|nr:hypothetical protein [Euryarchaeota archaeon]|tara:strand:+ start:575 stop:790 length:216 start_codon:yes stop_codon:yes gene_type:complete